jgi:glycosyltransferase involved in cell wall biosynthesis
MSADSPLQVSVVIPTFNRGFCIAQTIGSVLAQTCPAFEIIVVDDGSTDRTQAVVSSFGNRVRYLHQVNAGVSAARNLGIHAALGQWVALLDSDDEWHPEKLAIQCAELLAHPQAVAHMVDCQLGERDGLPTSIFEIRGLKNELGIRPLRVRPLLDVMQSAYFPSTWLVSKAVLLQAGLFNPAMRLCEDTDLLSRVALAGSFLTNCFVGTKLQRYEQSPGLSSLYPKAKVEYFSNIVQTYEQLLASGQLNALELAYVKKNLSATHLELALLHRIDGDRTSFRRSLLLSIRKSVSVLPLIKALVVLSLGTRGYEILRRLKDHRKSVHPRRSAAT